MEARHHALGGAGAVDLARAVIAACQQPIDFKFLYPLDLSIKASGRGSAGAAAPACKRAPGGSSSRKPSSFLPAPLSMRWPALHFLKTLMRSLHAPTPLPSIPSPLGMTNTCAPLASAAGED